MGSTWQYKLGWLGAERIEDMSKKGMIESSLGTRLDRVKLDRHLLCVC